MPSTLGIVASGVWTPAELAPDLWLDAADTSTISESGGSVSQWDNKGSLGNFTQASAASQPTTGVSTVNGLNVLDFATDRLNAVNKNEWKFLHDGTDFIIGAVWQAGTTDDPDAAYGLMGNNRTASSEVGFNVWFDDRNAQGKNNNLRTYVTIGVNRNFVLFIDSNSNYHPANQMVVLSGFYDPDNATISERALVQVDDNATITDNAYSQTPTSADPTRALQIGDVGNDQLGLTGKIAEIVVASGVNATETNRQILRDYLNAKWGVY